MSSQNNASPLIPSGKQIKKALIDLDMRYFDLAQDMGVSPIYIRYIANDQRVARELRKKIGVTLRKQYIKYGYPLPGWAKTISKKEKSA